MAQLAICLFSSLLILGCSTRHSSYTTIEGEALGTFVQVKYGGEVDSDVVTNLIREVDTEAKSIIVACIVSLVKEHGGGKWCDGNV